MNRRDRYALTRVTVAFFLCLFVFSGCKHVPTFGLFGSKPNYSYKDKDSLNGNASWYGPKFHGRRTANGEKYNMNGITAAHKTLPFNSVVRVTNLRNGKRVDVRINDRGPFIKGRIIDLSRGAAKKIDMINDGVVPVKLEVLKYGSG